jgi:hypothetical protein
VNENRKMLKRTMPREPSMILVEIGNLRIFGYIHETQSHEIGKGIRETAAMKGIPSFLCECLFRIFAEQHI